MISKILEVILLFRYRLPRRLNSTGLRTIKASFLKALLFLNVLSLWCHKAKTPIIMLQLEAVYSHLNLNLTIPRFRLFIKKYQLLEHFQGLISWV